MTAVTSTLVRTGTLSRTYGPDTDTCGHTRQPDIYAHVWRSGLRHVWLISAGRSGRTLGHGRAWTRRGAMVRAIAAAHRGDIGGGDV
jgi:hypothetical protein